MKKIILTITSVLLILALFAGCQTTQHAKPTTTGIAPTTPPATTTAVPTTATTTVPDDYEGDASTYYTDVVYAQQIERYYNAIAQQWDEGIYSENQMCPLAARYYEGTPLENIGFGFLDLDGDGIWELVIGGISDSDVNPLVFEIWTLKNDKPVMIAQSGSRNRYYLQYAEEDDLWSVANEAENGAASHAVYYLQLCEGEFRAIQGVIYDAAANETAPWFMTYDLDWDVSNDTAIDEATAESVTTAGRNLYTAIEYFPYSLYK